MWRTSYITWCDVHFVFPDVAYNILYLLMCRIYHYSDIIAFPDKAYILYILMWRTFCISWCGAQYIVSSDVACILFFRHTEHFLLRYILYYLMWRTLCISWCGVQYIVSSDVAYILFCRHRWHFLIKRTSCISWYGVHPVFPDVTYFLYFLMWRTLIAFTDMAYILYFLMWRISCISWCGVQYIVSPGVAYILFLIHA